MKTEILVIIALCMLVATENQLLTCSTASTSWCTVTGATCNLPSNYANCSVTWQGNSYLCSSPPTGHIYVAVTCTYISGCTTCSANPIGQVQPICEWRS